MDLRTKNVIRQADTHNNTVYSKCWSGGRRDLRPAIHTLEGDQVSGQPGRLLRLHASSPATIYVGNFLDGRRTNLLIAAAAAALNVLGEPVVTFRDVNAPRSFDHLSDILTPAQRAFALCIMYPRGIRLNASPLHPGLDESQELWLGSPETAYNRDLRDAAAREWESEHRQVGNNPFI